MQNKMTKHVVREWIELISDTISFGENDQRVFENAGLPAVNEDLSLSITLRLKIRKHGLTYATIFHKGTKDLIRTPGFWLTGNKSALCPRFTCNWNPNVGIDELGDGLSLNKCIQSVKTQKVNFNDGPLYIGCCHSWKGFNGEISNFRYFNWRLSSEEVKRDFFNSSRKPILYGSRIALVHVSTRKYLSTKGIKYDFGQQNQQYMVICNGQEIDLKSDVWTVIGANGKSVITGSPVSLNTTIGFKHQATGHNLHSHDTNYGRYTPISKQQQVTLCRDVNTDDDWLVQRYSPNTPNSFDNSGNLMSGEIIDLSHSKTNKSLYSHSIILGDGSQEVSCHKDESETNNKWRIELVTD
ncbi:glycosyltransferase family 39 protein [Rhizophagus clarus]|uniref:Glycosyltransferase family 39 protein n=1 Tax=Rhizophagus clarus TaxID=94130 RepID=A0A8H3KYA9_9GLOM|nr:glycosyltransferase family 39 protein [Rhizophagus clarus]